MYFLVPVFCLLYSARAVCFVRVKCLFLSVCAVCVCLFLLFVVLFCGLVGVCVLCVCLGLLGVFFCVCLFRFLCLWSSLSPALLVGFPVLLVALFAWFGTDSFLGEKQGGEGVYSIKSSDQRFCFAFQSRIAIFRRAHLVYMIVFDVF